MRRISEDDLQGPRLGARSCNRKAASITKGFSKGTRGFITETRG